MKKYLAKILSLMLVIVMFISLIGCNTNNGLNDDGTNNGKNNETTNNGNNSTGGTTCIIPNSYSLGYSVLPSAETYDYGDEIDINIIVKIPQGGVLPFVATDEIGTLSIAFQDETPIKFDETSYFEIIGDNEVVFENVKLNEYYHGDENGKSFSANFKIKITEPTYVVRNISFIVRFKADNENVSGGKAFYQLANLYFVGDSQGIIISSRPYNLDQNQNTTSTPNSDVAVMKKSLEREYNAGVGVEDLIDRYVRYIMEDSNYVFCEAIDDECYVTYISEGIRFKIYLPKNHQMIELYEEHNIGIESRNTYSENLLHFALSNEVITEEQYASEMERISEMRKNLSGSAFGEISRFFQDSIVPISESDDYYNVVVDLRNGS